MWNEVSNTATLVISGKICLNARIPIASALLCNGANSAKSSTCWITVSSTKAESLKISPPATTRCPTPVISSNEAIMFNATNCSNNFSTATSWFGISSTTSYF